VSGSRKGLLVPGAWGLVSCKIVDRDRGRRLPGRLVGVTLRCSVLERGCFKSGPVALFFDNLCLSELNMIVGLRPNDDVRRWQNDCVRRSVIFHYLPIATEHGSRDDSLRLCNWFLGSDTRDLVWD